MSNELATVEQLAIEDVKRLANIVRALRFDVFKPDLDFGVIPGTGTKPTLLLPGMEKLMRALHLRAEYIERSRIEDFDNNRIYYRYECRLIDYKTGECVATAIGSANSMESKWRWREQKRACPKCGKETINRSKFAPKGAPQGTEPGWYCYSKVGGCGSEFGASDPAIVSQQTGRIENPDIFDQMNTIDKIAQKRALSSAIKGAANVSEFFTVDLEDFERYDMPITVSIDDGRTVDVTTGEVAPAPMLTTPLQAGGQWTHTPENATSPKAMREREAAKEVENKPEATEDEPPPADEFDDIALSTRTPQQSEIGLVEPPKHPKNTRTWDIGRVANYVKFKAKHIDVEAEGEAGADAHFAAMINKLETRVRITDTSTTDEVIAAVDAYYADGHHLKDKKLKKASGQ